MEDVEITEMIIGAAVTVHRALGPGLLESAYEACLGAELQAQGLSIVKQVPVPIIYRGVTRDCGYRLDLVVEERVVVELKAVEKLLPIHRAQLISYLRLSGKTLGLLINFHEYRLLDGVQRLVHQYKPESPQRSQRSLRCKS